MKQLPEEVNWVWDARWTSYWIADKEFFDFTADDLDNRAFELKKAGINAVITFGAFHFRWCFVDEWQQLLKLLNNITESCHNHGIKVVEHHSANLISAPLGEDEWKSILKPKRGLNPTRHPSYISLLETGDKIYSGVKFSSMYQIDPTTGSFARTAYKGWVMCHNNPDYQQIYFDHLAEIYRCGVDGIMTDDICFFPKNYGCGCIHCRNKFKSETGYEMPPNGLKDKHFYGNLDNPAYRSWVEWRLNCNRQHQQRVFDHFRTLGLELARPIYSSSNTNSYAPRGLASTLDNLDGLYSTIFTEVNSTEPQAHCWLRIAAESKQRNALASRNGVPPMCLFYPSNKEENLFCWAITKSLGQNYWGTNWKMSFDAEAEMLQQGFNFESAHPKLYQHPESLAEVGVLFSAHTNWLHIDDDGEPDCIKMSDPAFTDCWAGWCEVLTLANIPFDSIGENDLAEERYLDRLRLIIIPNAVCLSNKAIEALKRFVANGGRAIITHQAGLKDETGEWHDKQPLAELIGAEYQKTIKSDSVWESTKTDKQIVNDCNPEQATPVAVFKIQKDMPPWLKLAERDIPVLFCNSFGQGKVITFAGKPGRMICINRHPRKVKDGKTFAEIDFSMNQAIVKLMEDSVSHLLDEKINLQTVGVPRGFIINMFKHNTSIVLHIINAAGILADSGSSVVIPAAPLKFPQASSLPQGKKVMLLKVRSTGTQAVLRSPEFQEEKKLPCSYEDGYTVIHMPADMVRCYSVIQLD